MPNGKKNCVMQGRNRMLLYHKLVFQPHEFHDLLEDSNLSCM